MENIKPLWVNKELPPLRQPNTIPPIQNTSSSVDTSTTLQNNLDKRCLSNIEEIVANSSLKADAPEFVPRTFESKPQIALTSKIQNRLKIHRSEAECDTVEKSEHHSEFVDNYMDTDSDHKRIRQIINTLTKDPGQFDNLLQIFMDTVAPYWEDLNLLSDIVEILVNEAIENANFRYTGAKLCWYIEQNCPSFRAELHMRCKKKLKDGKKLQNVLLFIAELYVQLPHENIYGALLVESFEKLLSEGSSESIKCICQALKLTGFSLETSNKKELDVIINRLDSMKCEASGNTLTLINKVLSLRKIDWGMADGENISTRKTSETSDENNLNYELEGANHVFFDEENYFPNTYLSDNTTLTQEEEEFLTANMSNEDFYSHPDSEDDPEMDEEIEEAYEEFLKTCKP